MPAVRPPRLPPVDLPWRVPLVSVIVLDLGAGYSCHSYTEKGVDGPTGLIVTGPRSSVCPMWDHDDPTKCSGGMAFECSPIAQREGRPRWKVLSLDPLTLNPSIRCKCDVDHPGLGQHGYITNGVWVNAGGIVA